MRRNFLAVFALAFLVMLGACKNEDKSSETSLTDKPSASSELLAMVMIDGKYGYIDTLGGFVIDPKYPLARSFSNGFVDDANFTISLTGNTHGSTHNMIPIS